MDGVGFVVLFDVDDLLSVGLVSDRLALGFVSGRDGI